MSEGVYTFQISRVSLKKNPHIHTYLICTKKQKQKKNNNPEILLLSFLKSWPRKRWKTCKPSNWNKQSEAKKRFLN